MTRQAEKMFADFHKYEAREVTQFGKAFRIPTTATCVGPAHYVLYRSAKCDPITYIKPNKAEDYIHSHKNGVKVYIVGSKDGPKRKVPKRIHEVGALTYLGKCLGFGYTDEDGDEVEATCKGKTELFTIPSGKALLVIENRRKVSALIWGGKLNVEPRGIVG